MNQAEKVQRIRALLADARPRPQPATDLEVVAALLDALQHAELLRPPPTEKRPAGLAALPG